MGYDLWDMIRAESVRSIGGTAIHGDMIAEIMIFGPR